MNFPQIFGILTGIPGSSFKVLQNSGIPQDFESAGSGVLHKLQLSFLEILKLFPNSVSSIEGVWIFSGIAQRPQLKKLILAIKCFVHYCSCFNLRFMFQFTAFFNEKFSNPCFF